MKKYSIISLLIVATMSCNTQSTSNIKSEVNQIRAVLDSQQIAWNNGDLVGFMNGYSKDTALKFISNRGVRIGWYKTLLAYKKGYSTKELMGRLEFQIDTIQLLDKAATIGNVIGKWTLYRQLDTPSGHFSLVTKKMNAQHKIILDHTW